MSKNTKEYIENDAIGSIFIELYKAGSTHLKLAIIASIDKAILTAANDYRREEYKGLKSYLLGGQA